MAVSSDGSLVLAGVWDEKWTSSAYVFDGATGAQLLKLQATDGANHDGFGRSMAVSADGALVVAGAWGDDGPGTWTGSAYVFDGDIGAQLLKLRAADGVALDSVGWLVAVSSNGAGVVVGAYYGTTTMRAKLPAPRTSSTGPLAHSC
ncbi:unnamed protein product [Prorocentrum cordatum]|uniref:Uncharacterized protein n=1 Tax=Prorocentrum cordatum TaxID=2364126 RepID=A0ABN9TW50_9DINO|nr:unnamed protein product [Polarella glacialis]